MTKQDLAEVVGYIKDMEFTHNCAMEGQKATLNHCSRKDYEDKQALQKELAEVKSKLDEAKAEINKANARGLRWMEAKNHWENRALIAEEGYRRKQPSNVDDPKATERNTPTPRRLLVEVVPKKDEKHGTRRKSFEDGTAISVYNEIVVLAGGDGPAMSIQELPPMPSWQEMDRIGCIAAGRHEPCGNRDFARKYLKAAFKACGLEVV